MPIEPRNLHNENKTGESAEGNGRENPSLEAYNSMDPVSATFSAIALTETALTATSKFHKLYSNYQNATKDSHHIEGQRKQLKLNKSLLDQLASDLPVSFRNELKSSLADIDAALPDEPCLVKKKDKLRWVVLGGKPKSQDKIAKLKDIESSATFSLLLTALNKWKEISNAVTALTNQISERDRKLALYEKELESLEACTRSQLSNNSRASIDQEIAANIYCWNWIARLGINLQLIMTYGDFLNIYTILLRWPLFFNVLLIWRIGVLRGWPTGIQFNLRLRAEIPSDSAIIRACQENNLNYIRQLLRQCPAHVNGVTPDNLTLLRFAIYAGHAEVVELLLNNGADPNQTFTRHETSPLDIAFLLGRADIVRLLLRSSVKVDLEYINRRTWTCVYYLWDPGQPQYPTVSEILDICGNREFRCWNTRDSLGWAPLHRAAAFGKAEHISKIFNMRLIDPHVVLHPSTTPLTQLGWSPIQCAVMNGNISTFNSLIVVAETIGVPFKVLANMKDKRGWNLLHLAAASGSEDMMALLLAKGFDVNACTDAASLGLPEILHHRHLKPCDIAECYGNITQYNNIFSPAQTLAI